MDHFWENFGTLLHPKLSVTVSEVKVIQRSRDLGKAKLKISGLVGVLHVLGQFSSRTRIKPRILLEPSKSDTTETLEMQKSDEIW